MEFIETSIVDERAKIFLDWAQREWPLDFAEDFAPDISAFKNDLVCILGVKGDDILVGGLLSKKIINSVEGEGELYAKKLKDMGFLNFTYFVVKRSSRGRGVGSSFLDYLRQRYSKIWIDANPHNFAFYQKRGFTKQIPTGVGERFILTLTDE